MQEESSRVCVKQLSKFMTEPKLREIFSKVGTVTDLKIVKTKDGRPRGFGFVGFKDADEARMAVRRLNKSYIGGGKIVVEIAKAVGDGALPRPWSRYTPGSSQYAISHGLDPSKSKPSEENSRASGDAASKDRTGVRDLVPRDDPLYQEFAGVMNKGDGSRATWTNDEPGAGARAIKGGTQPRRGAAGGALDSESESVSGTCSDNDDDNEGSGDMKDKEEDEDEGPADGLSSANLAFLKRASGRGSGGDGGGNDNDSEPKGPGDEDEDEDDEFQVVDGELIQSKSKSKSKAGKKRGRDSIGKGGEQVDNEDEDEDEDGNTAGKRGTVEEVPEFDENRLFVRNLPYAATEKDVRSHFGDHGVVSEVVVPRDSSGKGKGICFVTFEEPASAARAMHAADGHVFMGRLVHVMPARPPPKSAGDGTGGEGDDGFQGDRRRVGQSSYKAALEAKRKEAARTGRESNVWNTLLVRADVALASAAKSASTSAEEVMDPTASNAAVRLALGETAVIDETKGFLRQEGVDLDLLESGLKGLPITRSDTVILVKQLPPDVEREAVRSLFSRSGPLVRCVMPPAKSICLIEFEQPAAAKKAFRSLAYTRFMRVPLYLEWAPDKLFAEDTEVSERSRGAVGPDPSDERTSAGGALLGDGSKAVGRGDAADDQSGSGGASAAAIPASLDGKTVFIKNLAFSTTQDRLKELVDTVGKTRAVHIPTRKERRGGKDVTLSLGYGFVEYQEKADAMEAIKRLQGAMLDGHSIELKLSKKQTGPSAAYRASASQAVKDAKAKDTPDSTIGQGSKLLVKNLAFEATRQDLRELFGAFGKLQSVRVPRRHDGQHRGFGFVDFASAEDARTAADKLGATHLYGRKLVIAWPNVESSEAVAQRKAVAGPGGPGMRQAGRRAGAAFGIPRGGGASSASAAEDGDSLGGK